MSHHLWLGHAVDGRRHVLFDDVELEATLVLDCGRDRLLRLRAKEVEDDHRARVAVRDGALSSHAVAALGAPANAHLEDAVHVMLVVSKAVQEVAVGFDKAVLERRV